MTFFHKYLRIVLPCLVANLLMASVSVLGASAPPYFGFTPFPYDLTTEAQDKVYNLIAENSNLFALHLDNGIPWQESIDNRPFPGKIQNEWDEWRKRIPKGHPVYLGLAPLGKDRKTLAPARGERDGLQLPAKLSKAPLDDPRVKEAYLNYARRAVQFFRPKYLNLGIEAGELASRDPARWPQFEGLFNYVASALRREYPDVKIGISFGLQSLRKPPVAEKARKLLKGCDYVGLSFYPHMSGFGEKFGDPPLGNGANSWREPLEWVKNFAGKKPTAITETGYSTQNVRIPRFKLDLKGDGNLQTQYVKDLLGYAKRDHYLFVVWFLVVDYDQLYKKLPKDEANLLWRNIGLIDSDLKPKPAWREWSRWTKSGKPAQMSASSVKRVIPGSSGNSMAIGFSQTGELFTCAPGAKIELTGNGPNGRSAMFWQYSYKAGEWAWCVRDMPEGFLKNARNMEFYIRSDRPGQLFIQLEERSGEAFYLVTDVGTEWKKVNIPVSSLNPDKAKKKNGRLEMDHVTRITIADAGGRASSKGDRTVLISDWNFRQ